jgi:hypothetical protein
VVREPECPASRDLLNGHAGREHQQNERVAHVTRVQFFRSGGLQGLRTRMAALSIFRHVLDIVMFVIGTLRRSLR